MVVCQPEPSASPGNLWEIQILRSHARPTELEILSGQSNLCFNKHPGKDTKALAYPALRSLAPVSLALLKFEEHWSRQREGWGLCWEMMDSIENFLVSENLTFMSLMECKKTHRYPWNHFFVFRKKPEPPIWWVEPACCHAEQQLALWVYRLF